MRFKVFLEIFIAFLCICGANPEKSKSRKCGYKNGVVGNVWGGHDTIKNAWAWVVALRYRPINDFFCGGSLVSAKHVVSAAHCFQQKYKGEIKAPWDVRALIGKHNLNKEEEGSAVHAVWEILIHQDWDYNDDSYDADISLIVLETEVDLTHRGSVRIVCLPQPKESSEVLGTGTVVGWGVSERSDASYEPHDSTPNEIQLPAVTLEQCDAANDDFYLAISNRTFCAGFVNEDKAACRGDSGGGFFLLDKLTRTYNLAGVVSASLYDPKLHNCRTDTYSVFTDVSKFVGWIKKQMEETKEIKWITVDFECSLNVKLDNQFDCHHKFTGLFSRRLKIQQSFENVSDAAIDFGGSTTIFAGLAENFPNLKDISIMNQNIKFIEHRNFDGLEKLESLNLINNAIENLDNDTFQGLTNLIILNIYENKINKLPENIFRSLMNLEKIDVSANQLKELPENVFWGLINLKELWLDRNRIKTLSENIFSNLRSLKWITLSRNDFERLPKYLFLNNLKLEDVFCDNNTVNTNDIDFSQIPNVRLYNGTDDKKYYQSGEHFYLNRTKIKFTSMKKGLFTRGRELSKNDDPGRPLVGATATVDHLKILNEKVLDKTC